MLHFRRTKNSKPSGRNFLISQTFFVELNRIDALFKVSTGGIEPLHTIKRFNKNESNKIKKN